MVLFVIRSYQRQIDILEKNIDAQNRDLLESQRELMHWKDVAHSRVNNSNTNINTSHVFGNASTTPYSSTKLSPSLARTSGRSQVQTLPISQVVRSRTTTPARDRQPTTDASSFFAPLSAGSTKTTVTTPTFSLSHVPDDRDTATPSNNNKSNSNNSGLNATQLVQDATNDLKDIMFALGL